MLKELIEIFSECEQMKTITPCSSAVQCNTVALMPEGGRIIKRYTDGKTLNSLRLKLLYKAPFSPAGDYDFSADCFFDGVRSWLDRRFDKGSEAKNGYDFILASIPTSYVIENKTPSAAIYSLELTVNYLIL